MHLGLRSSRNRVQANTSPPKKKIKSSRIWRLIEQKDWDKVRILLKSSAEKGVNLANKTDFFGTHSVFSFTLQFNPPLDIVQTMTKLYPGALSDEDFEGRLPLHIACHHGASYRVMNFLLGEYPRSATWGDESGRIPLHYATATACRDPRDKKRLSESEKQQEKQTRGQLKVLGSLLLAAPASVLTVDHDGVSALDIAKAFMIKSQQLDEETSSAVYYDTLSKVTESVLLQNAEGATSVKRHNVETRTEENKRNQRMSSAKILQ